MKLCPKWNRGKYFRNEPRARRMDGRVVREQASCCGVNLAVAGLWVSVFFGKNQPLAQHCYNL